MLVYDNGRVCVLANTRCGHTSMYQYFGLEPYTVATSIHDWYNTTSRRVLVLRNPFDRWASALKHRVNKPPRITDHEWFLIHGMPYLRDLVWRYRDVSYIDFYKLGEYIPLSSDSVLTHSNYSAPGSISAPPGLRIPGTELHSELVAYRMFRRYSKELTVAEWQELTGVGGSNG
jgi:hypothetical protein